MTLRIYENHAAAELNKAVDATVPGGAGVQSIGPVQFELENQGSAEVVLSARKLSDDSLVLTHRDTAQSAESTAYTGNGSTTDFTGQALNVLPVVPGSVVLIPATSGPDLIDKNRDGNLVTDDADNDLGGTIDYFTGVLELSYPVGKEPDGLISADYTSQDSTLKAKAKKVYLIDNVLQEETVVPAVACNDRAGSFVKINGVATWI